MVLDEENLAINKTDYSYIGSNLAVYVLFTGAALAGLVALHKSRQNWKLIILIYSIFQFITILINIIYF